MVDRLFINLKMLCPYCAGDESNVLESRDAEDGQATRRRRECIKCSKRFTTYERVGNIELKVIKKDEMNIVTNFFMVEKFLTKIFYFIT